MATSQVETVNTGADKAKLVGAGVLVLLALVAYYFLGKQGALVQWLALLVGVAAAVGLFFTSESGRQLIAFGRESVKEVKRWYGQHARKLGR